MLDFKEGTDTSSEHGNRSATVATTMPLRATTSLHSRSGSLCSSGSKRSPSGFPSSDGSEPQADVVLHPSALHLVERIFKRLMKLRKKALLTGYSSCFGLDPYRAVVMEDGAIRSYVNVDVDVERGYDSDEQSSAGFVSADTPTSSSSMGSYSFESLVATSSSNGTQLPANSHRPGSQMMATMLLSLLNDDAGFTLQEDDGSGNESEEEYHFGGPRESAWHQPEDEILTDQEWRMMRYGHLQPALAATAGPKLRSSNLSCKCLAMGVYSSSKQPTIAAARNSSSARSKRETSKHM